MGKRIRFYRVQHASTPTNGNVHAKRKTTTPRQVDAHHLVSPRWARVTGVPVRVVAHTHTHTHMHIHTFPPSRSFSPPFHPRFIFFVGWFGFYQSLFSSLFRCFVTVVVMVVGVGVGVWCRLTHMVRFAAVFCVCMFFGWCSCSFSFLSILGV